MSRAAADIVGADSSDVTRLERTVDDAQVTITIVDSDEKRVVVEEAQTWEFDIDDDDLAHPRADADVVPPWVEALLQTIGLRGIRMAPVSGGGGQ